VLPCVLRPTVLGELHDNMGHQGVDRTAELLRQRVYWPGMQAHAKGYVRKCERCTLSSRPRPNFPTGHLLASRPLEVVAVDFTTLEPGSDGRENVLIMTDVF